MATVDRFEEVIKEYLLFKGFNGAYKAFENDLKNEKDKGFRVDKIMDQIHMFVNSHDLNGLRELWSFLDSRMFCRLDQTYGAAVRKLENSLLKHYVIHCVQSNRNEKVQEFFEKMAQELQNQSEWREWFVLPWCKCPEDDKTFSMYFSKQWQDTLYLSLHNFLSVIVQAMPIPRGLGTHDAEIRKIKKLEEENAKLRQQVKDLLDNKDTGARGQGQSQASLSESILSPSDTMSGPSAMDLMDDFYVIAQETKIEDTPKTTRSQPIKSFLSTIGRSSPGTTRKQTTAQPGKNGNNKIPSPSATKKQESSSYNRSKSDPVKQHASQPKAGNTSAVQGKSPNTGRPKSVDIQAKVPTPPLQSRPKEKSSIPVPSKFKRPDVTTSFQASTSNQDSQQIANPPIKPPEDPKPAAVKPKSESSTRNVVDGSPIVTAVPPFSLLSQEEYGEHQSAIIHCRFSRTGHSVATLDSDGVIKVWGLQPSPVTTATVMSKSMLQSVEWVGMSDQWLLLGSKAGSIRLFDVNRKQIEREANVEESYTRVSALSCSSQGTHFACAASGRKKTDASGSAKGGELNLWDLKTMEISKRLKLSPGPVPILCICHSDTGKLLLTGGSDGYIRLFACEGDSEESVMQWHAHQGEVYTVAFSNDNRSCFSMGADGKFMEWSLSTAGKRLSTLHVHTGASGPFVMTGPGSFRHCQTAKDKLFAFNADQRHVITCANDGGCIYNVNQTKEAKTIDCSMLLKGHKAPVVSVDWSAATDTMMCLSASLDGKIRVSTLLAH